MPFALSNLPGLWRRGDNSPKSPDSHKSVNFRDTGTLLYVTEVIKPLAPCCSQSHGLKMRHLLLAAAAAVFLSGCTYERTGSPTLHYNEFRSIPPRGNTVWVCSAYGCQEQSKIRFTSADIAKIRGIINQTKRSDTPHEERRGIAYAIAWMEKHVGKEIGTQADRPCMDFRGSGDPSQQDCVDEATNTTSYLLVMQHNNLLKHHRVARPFSKGNILQGTQYWPHWTAVLVENETGQRYAVDSWIYENGENPAVVEAEKWYIDDLDNLPESTT